MDVAKIAYNKFKEKLEVCRDMFHGFDYSEFGGESDLARSQAISGAVNFILGIAFLLFDVLSGNIDFMLNDVASNTLVITLLELYSLPMAIALSVRFSLMAIGAV